MNNLVMSFPSSPFSLQQHVTPRTSDQKDLVTAREQGLWYTPNENLCFNQWGTHEDKNILYITLSSSEKTVNSDLLILTLHKLEFVVYSMQYRNKSLY